MVREITPFIAKKNFVKSGAGFILLPLSVRIPPYCRKAGGRGPTRPACRQAGPRARHYFIPLTLSSSSFKITQDAVAGFTLGQASLFSVRYFTRKKEVSMTTGGGIDGT
jgi:hypothetical protein